MFCICVEHLFCFDFPIFSFMLAFNFPFRRQVFPFQLLSFASHWCTLFLFSWGLGELPSIFTKNTCWCAFWSPMNQLRHKGAQTPKSIGVCVSVYVWIYNACTLHATHSLAHLEQVTWPATFMAHSHLTLTHTHTSKIRHGRGFSWVTCGMKYVHLSSALGFAIYRTDK